jgi:hypothetical protein
MLRDPDPHSKYGSESRTAKSKMRIHAEPDAGFTTLLSMRIHAEPDAGFTTLLSMRIHAEPDAGFTTQLSRVPGIDVMAEARRSRYGNSR